MEIEKIDINKLNPSIYNPRKDLKKDDAEYIKLKKSIEEFGYVEPILINRDYTVIGGHQRLKVLKDLNYDVIDCTVVDVDKTKEKALNVALNKISGEWDNELLKDLMQELQDANFDMELTGFDENEIENMMVWYEDSDDLNLGNNDMSGDTKEKNEKMIFVFYNDEDLNYVKKKLNIANNKNTIDSNILIDYMKRCEQNGLL